MWKESDGIIEMIKKKKKSNLQYNNKKWAVLHKSTEKRNDDTDFTCILREKDKYTSSYDHHKHHQYER